LAIRGDDVSPTAHHVGGLNRVPAVREERMPDFDGSAVTSRYQEKRHLVDLYLPNGQLLSAVFDASPTA
jgi:hypothetical protein